MAAIIAQLTRAKRERANKKTYEPNKVLKCGKSFKEENMFKSIKYFCQCMYELDPFDAHFDPEKHNKYLVR